jgi:topoisomerase-4 subunit B
MGKNTPQRQDFIIDNLRVEKDLVEANEEETVSKTEETLA